jgi:hypothetical protein
VFKLVTEIKFFFYYAVNNNKNISIYFTIIKALKQVNNIVNRDISPQAD